MLAIDEDPSAVIEPQAGCLGAWPSVSGVRSAATRTAPVDRTPEPAGVGEAVQQQTGPLDLLPFEGGLFHDCVHKPRPTSTPLWG
jgi:hypothetical protein